MPTKNNFVREDAPLGEVAEVVVFDISDSDQELVKTNPSTGEKFTIKYPYKITITSLDGTTTYSDDTSRELLYQTSSAVYEKNGYLNLSQDFVLFAIKEIVKAKYPKEYEAAKKEGSLDINKFIGKKFEVVLAGSSSNQWINWYKTLVHNGIELQLIGKKPVAPKADATEAVETDGSDLPF